MNNIDVDRKTKIVSEIMNLYFDINENQESDRDIIVDPRKEDFHSIHINTLRYALNAAYMEGTVNGIYEASNVINNTKGESTSQETQTLITGMFNTL